MQMRNQSAAADQKQREMEHKLRVRTKELVDLQVIASTCETYCNTVPLCSLG